MSIINREVKNACNLSMRPVLHWQRNKNFPTSTSQLIKMVNAGFTNFGYLRNDQGVNQNSNSVVNYADFSGSVGSMVRDADGNYVLDLSTNGSLNPVGYNHRLFKAYAYGKQADNSLINGFAADALASANFQDTVRTVFSQVAPDGLRGITLVNERNATGAAVQHAMVQRSQDRNNKWSALYFTGSTHGSPLTLGGRLCRWPHVAFPASEAEESQVLESVRNAATSRRNGDAPLAAIVIEPTQQSTGYVARKDFINALRSIANDFEAALVIDETSTGCYASGTGHFWQYTGHADYVSFGRRTQASGFFHANEDQVIVAGNENDVNLFDVIL